MDGQYSSCFLEHPPQATFVDKPSAGSGPTSGCEPSLVNGFHFHQFLCVLAVISIGSCYVLPVSTGIDGSPRQIQNYLEIVKGLDGYPTFEKNVDVPTCVALFYILHYTSLNGIYCSLEYCAVEPKTEAVPPSQASSIHPSTSSFIYTRWGSLFCLCWTCSAITLVRELDLKWLVVCLYCICNVMSDIICRMSLWWTPVAYPGIFFGGGFNKFSWGQRTERTGIWGW